MRIFAALSLPEDVRAAVEETLAILRHQYHGAGRWARAENLHLTLAFIGEVPAEIAASAAAAAAQAEPVMLSWKINRFGTFGRQGILWCGLEDCHPAEALASAVRERLSERGIPFDAKPFRAHITLARNWTGPRPEALPQRYLPGTDASLRAACAKLFASEPGEDGQIRYRWVRAKPARL